MNDAENSHLEHHTTAFTNRSNQTEPTVDTTAAARLTSEASQPVTGRVTRAKQRQIEGGETPIPKADGAVTTGCAVTPVTKKKAVRVSTTDPGADNEQSTASNSKGKRKAQVEEEAPDPAKKR